MGRYSVFRDDDVNCFTDIGLLKYTHDLIESRGKVHTVAVEVESIWRAKSVWFFLMTAKNLDVVLHGWDHSDYSQLDRDTIYKHVEKSLHYWDHHSAAYDHPHTLTTWCPPWNRTSEDMWSVATDHRLTIDTRWKGDSDVYGFHHWEISDPAREAKLIKALES
jgi:peptidoglycan/xylan/chitin deacetylase (PgdA/CDA1 family)